MERTKARYLRHRISWGSIFAGTVTVLAISILLSILSTSIGLFMFDPLSDHPTSGIGTTVGIWTAIALIISLISGGFVAGKLAGEDGFIHGFLVWATTLIITVILGAMLAAGAVKLTANILGSVSSATGSVLSGVGSVVKDGASEISDQAKDVFGNIDLNTNLNGNNLQKNVRDALRRSGVKEFQPYYLQNQLNQVKTDLKKTIKKVVANPEDANDIINNFLDRLQNRTENFAKSINREDLTRAIANNSDMSQAEVEKAVDQYIDLTNQAIQQGKEEINNLEQTIEKARQDWEVMKQKALIKAEKASKAAARSALISFIAILIGAALCAFAGLFGSRKTREGYEA